LETGSCNHSRYSNPIFYLKYIYVITRWFSVCELRVMFFLLFGHGSLQLGFVNPGALGITEVFGRFAVVP
jgi:hypothetical protein